MNLRYLISLPIVASLLLAGSVGVAHAAPDVTNPFAELAAGSEPSHILVDPSGDIFTLNTGNESISKIHPDGAFDATFHAELPSFSLPNSFASDGRGSLYVSSYLASTVWKVDARTGDLDASFSTHLGTELDGQRPQAVTVDPLGTLFVATYNPEAVVAIAPTGDVISRVPLAHGSGPVDIASDSHGSIYTANAADDTISRVSFDGGGGATVDSDFIRLVTGSMPISLALNGRGMLFAADSGNNTVSGADLALPPGSAPVTMTVMPTGSYPYHLTADSHGNIVVTNLGTASFAMIEPDGRLTPVIAQLSSDETPEAAVVSSTGQLYTANALSSTVSRIGLAPSIQSAAPATTARVGDVYSATVAATGLDPMTYEVAGDAPFGLTIDPASGVLSGTPTVTGTFTFDVMASNAAGSASQSATITVAPAERSTGCWYWHESCGF